MSLIGDIVEKTVDAPTEMDVQAIEKSTSNLKISKKPSRWKQRLQKKQISPNTFANELSKISKDEEELTESEKIHLENLKHLASMTPEQIAHEREELMDSISPKILEALMRKQKKGDEYLKERGDGGAAVEKKKEENEEKKEKEENAKEEKEVKVIEVKQEKTEKQEIQEKEKKQDIMKKQVKFEEPKTNSESETKIETKSETEYHTENQNIEKENIFGNIHFPKNPKPTSESDYKLDLNDPNFVDKLHDKYFPDLPKDTEKLEWMMPVDAVARDIVLSPDELRFDFKGDIIPADKDVIDKISVASGLYHHSDNPELPGYTIKELAHLMRSKFSAQRCISIRTIGRVIHKLALHKLNIMVEEDEQSTLSNKDLKSEFEEKLWKQISQLRVIPLLIMSSDENLTSTLSVRNYAIEALWLYRESGGDKTLKDIEDKMAKARENIIPN